MQYINKFAAAAAHKPQDVQMTSFGTSTQESASTSTGLQDRARAGRNHCRGTKKAEHRATTVTQAAAAAMAVVPRQAAAAARNPGSCGNWAALGGAGAQGNGAVDDGVAGRGGQNGNGEVGGARKGNDAPPSLSSASAPAADHHSHTAAAASSKADRSDGIFLLASSPLLLLLENPFVGEAEAPCCRLYVLNG